MTKTYSGSFESAMTRLEEIVEKLSSEKATLDEMIQLYQEGMELKEFCSQRLESAKMKIETISKNKEILQEKNN